MRDLGRRCAGQPEQLPVLCIPQSNRDISWHAGVVLPPLLPRGDTSRWDLHRAPVGCSSSHGGEPSKGGLRGAGG